MKEIIDIVHKSILPFFDVCENEEEPLSDKDKLLLKVNKAICNNLKALERESRWIPVSERLPEDYGEYICTMSNDNVQECGFVPSDENGLISGWSTCEAEGFKKLDYQDVKAWMPLPQPYKAESEK